MRKASCPRVVLCGSVELRELARGGNGLGKAQSRSVAGGLFERTPSGGSSVCKSLAKIIRNLCDNRADETWSALFAVRHDKLPTSEMCVHPHQSSCRVLRCQGCNPEKNMAQRREDQRPSLLPRLHQFSAGLQPVGQRPSPRSINRHGRPGSLHAFRSPIP